MSWWDANVSATEENEQRRVAAELALSDALADADLFGDIATARANGAEPLVRRQLDLLHASLVPQQVPESLRHRIVELEASVESRFAQHRGEVSGRPVDDNEIKRILRESDDVAERREAWEASKTVAPRWRTTCGSSRGSATRRLGRSATATGSRWPSTPRRWTRRGSSRRSTSATG